MYIKHDYYVTTARNNASFHISERAYARRRARERGHARSAAAISRASVMEQLSATESEKALEGETRVCVRDTFALAASGSRRYQFLVAISYERAGGRSQVRSRVRFSLSLSLSLSLSCCSHSSREAPRGLSSGSRKFSGSSRGIRIALPRSRPDFENADSVLASRGCYLAAANPRSARRGISSTSANRLSTDPATRRRDKGSVSYTRSAVYSHRCNRDS